MSGRRRGTPEDEALRGHLYAELDLLSFALEMEAAERLHEGDEQEAIRLQDRRLGVRLAQRLVSGVWADEVGLRLQRWREAYRRRLEETLEGRARREPCHPAGEASEQRDARTGDHG